MADFHLIAHYFLQTSPVVQIVLGTLLLASILSWTAIIQQGVYLRRLQHLNRQFYTLFLANQQNLNNLYQTLHQPNSLVQGSAQLFHSGFKTFQKACQQQWPKHLVIQDVERTTNIVLEQQLHRLEAPLTLLATIAAVSPYVGLLGTVWGIMHTLQALGHSDTMVRLATVAPGISEALLTTAIGLLTAIPATVAYNYCANTANRITQHYENVQQQLITQLSISHYQQKHISSHETSV